MSTLATHAIRYALAGLITLAIAWAVYHRGYAQADAEWAARWAEQVARLEGQRAAAIAAVQQTEADRRLKLAEIVNDAKQREYALAADLAAAGVESDRLRERARAVARQCAAVPDGSAAASGSPAASNPGDLLADVLARADEAAGELARIADEYHAAGLACESAYAANR